MEANDPLPCPFCKSTRFTIYGADDIGYKLFHRCEGDSCFTIEIARNVKTDVIAAWNTREALANPLLASIEWHRVSEGLPEKDGKYLVAYKDGSVETDRFWTDQGRFFSRVRGNPVTHWALPQAPADQLARGEGV